MNKKKGARHVKDFKVLEIKTSVFADNNLQAGKLREELKGISS